MGYLRGLNTTGTTRLGPLRQRGGEQGSLQPATLYVTSLPIIPLHTPNGLIDHSSEHLAGPIENRATGAVLGSNNSFGINGVDLGTMVLKATGARVCRYYAPV